MSTSTQSIKKKILVILLGLLFSFILLEILLRLVAFEPATLFSSKSKSGDEYTLMAVGNSHTYGTGAPVGLGYPEQLERMLNSERGERYHMVNRGLRNINSTFIKENIDSWIEEDHPKIVFIMVGEPNSWNRYGYWNYLKKRNKGGEAGILERLDFLRVFSTYKLIELLLNREESWFGSSGYSNTFRGYKKSDRHEDKIYLGYSWIGSLEEYDNFDFRSLRPEQSEEALEMLNYVWEQDKNPSALRLIAEYYLMKKETFPKGLEYLQQAVEKNDVYCFPCHVLIEKLYPKVVSSAQRKLILIRNILDKKPGKLPYHDIVEFLFAAENPKRSLDERMKIAEAMSIAYPGSIRALNVIYHAGANTHTSLYIQALQRTLKTNPLAATGDLAQKIYGLRKINPANTKVSEELFAQMEAKFKGTSFKEIANVNDIVGEWAISDLDAIVTSVVKSGAKAVVQTYPRVRSGPPRALDELIRKWWQTKKNKNNIEFLDVNKILHDKFEKGGDYYYATHLGPYDNHVNEHGYKEIATLMIPYVPPVK